MKSSKQIDRKNYYLTEWAKTIGAKNLQKSLIQHFGFLNDTAGHSELLTLIMKEVTKAHVKNNTLILEFGKTDKLIAHPPSNDENKIWPESFREILAHHEEITLEKAQISLGTRGSFESEFLEESDWAENVNIDKVLSPITEYADWWIYHPKKKTNRNNQHFIFSRTKKKSQEMQKKQMLALFF